MMDAMFSFPTLLIFSKNLKRESNYVRPQNIAAAKTIAELIRTNLGPMAMYKMLMDPMGGVVMTNDGNAILREIIVQHPVAKMLIEIARTQDEEVGDGTTSVILLCGEILSAFERYLDTYHPYTLIRDLRRALDDILTSLAQMTKPVDIKNSEEVLSIAKACLGTKFLSTGWSHKLCDLSVRAVNIVRESLRGKERIDITSFVRIEKLPGGTLDDSQLIEGVVINKDIIHPKMRRLILNPRIILLCTGLEYKKGASVTNVEITSEGGYTRMLDIEEEQVTNMCKIIISHKPDVVITEKGISDLAIHHLAKAGISALRRVKQMDIVRLSRVCGATIMGRVEEINEKNIGTRAGRFEVKILGDDYFTFISDCKDIKACTLFLRGPSKDILHELERNLHDVMNIIRNIYFEPSVVPGAGAIEMKLFTRLASACQEFDSEVTPYFAALKALKIIPRTLLENTGCSPLHGMNELEAKHFKGETYGVNGVSGELVDVSKLEVWESTRVKCQVYKSAIETAIQILKVDEIVSGTKSREKQEQAAQKKAAGREKPQSGEKGQGDTCEG